MIEYKCGHEEIVELILAILADINQNTYNGNTAVLHVIENNSKDVV